MTSVVDIIGRLGGRKAVSDALSIPYTTVQGWEVSDFVPDWRRPGLLALAMQLDKPLSTDDFPAKRKVAA
jgi:hypothetical protein